MLYSQFVLAVVLLATHSVLGTLDETAAACNKETGFTGDIQKIDFSDPALPKEAKCFVACVFDKRGAFKPDGSIDKEKDKGILEEMIKDEELRKKYLNAIEECDVSAKANKCETAYEYLKCLSSKVGHN